MQQGTYIAAGINNAVCRQRCLAPTAALFDSKSRQPEKVCISDGSRTWERTFARQQKFIRKSHFYVLPFCRFALIMNVQN